MDIGIGLPNTVPGTEGTTLLDWAKNAEEAGFSTLGTIGRLVYPNYEELIALSAAAAVTSRIRLTTSVLLAPLYANTALFAKQAASLDRLSGGRLVLGLGLGGRDDDFTASALPTTGKGQRFDQQLTEMKRIWAGESYGYAGAIGPEPSHRRRLRESYRTDCLVGSGRSKAWITRRVKSISDRASAPPTMSLSVLRRIGRRRSRGLPSTTASRSAGRTSRCWTPAASTAWLPRSVRIHAAASTSDRAILVLGGLLAGCTSSGPSRRDRCRKTEMPGGGFRTWRESGTRT